MAHDVDADCCVHSVEVAHDVDTDCWVHSVGVAHDFFDTDC